MALVYLARRSLPPGDARAAGTALRVLRVNHERWLPDHRQVGGPRSWSVLAAVLGGDARLATAGAACRLSRGDALLLPQRRACGLRAGRAGCELLLLRFLDPRPASPHAALYAAAPGRWRAPALAPAMSEILAAAGERPPDAGFVAALLDAALHRLRRAAALAPAQEPVAWLRLRAELDRIETRPGGLAAIARRCHLAPAALRRLCGRHAGCGPVRYVVGRLMERAAWMLADGDAPIAEIAARLGYDDPFRFSRAFRRIHRISPSGFRGHQRHAPAAGRREAGRVGVVPDASIARQPPPTGLPAAKLPEMIPRVPVARGRAARRAH